MARARTFRAVNGPSFGAVALACLTLSACGGGGGSSDDDAPSNPAPPPASPSAEVADTSVDFGKVVVGQSNQRQVSITNTGNVDLDINAGVDGFAFSVNGDCTDLAPGQSCDLTVGFTPSEQQTFTADLDLTSSIDLPAVTLTGEGIDLNVQISNLDVNCTVSPSTVTGRVIVSDGQNNPLVGLDVGDFNLLVDGTAVDPFEVEALTVSDPISVGFAVDISGSLAGSRNNIAQQTGFFLDEFFEPDDTAGVFRFASVTNGSDLEQGFLATTDTGKETLKDTFDRPADDDLSLDDTVLWDTANAVLEVVLEEQNSERAVVVLSDGQDTLSTATLEDVVANASAANVPFFSVGFGDTDTAALEELANGTGGIFFTAPDDDQAAALETIFTSIGDNVTNQYDVSFSLPAPDPAVELTVTVEDFNGRQGEDSRELSCPQ